MDNTELLMVAAAIALPIGLAIPAYLLIPNVCRWPDYISVAAGACAWFGLVFSGVGPQSLSHLIEYPIIEIVVLAALYFRVIFLGELRDRKQMVASYGMLAFALLLPLVVRLTIPEMPE